MSVRIKLFMLLALSLIIMAGVGGAAVYSLQRLHAAIITLAENSLPSSQASGDMSAAAATYRLDQAARQVAVDPQEASRYENMQKGELQNFKEAHDKYEQLNMADDEKALFGKVDEVWGAYLKESATLSDLLKQNRMPEANALFDGHLHQSFVAVDDAINDLTDKNVTNSIAAKRDASESYNIALMGLGGAVGLGAIVQLLAMAWIIYGISGTLHHLSLVYAESAEKMGRSTSQVGEAVSSMVAASEETSRQTTVVRKNSTEASGYVSSVSNSVDELNISINDISKSISDTNVVIDDAVTKANTTNGVVRNLGEATSKISDVVKLINDLSEQTSLLALNAAIEAARAGDAGRGFAVVADEVKKLANHTAEATAGIGEQVRTIQQVSEQSITSLQEVVQAIHRIRDNATTVSAAVEEQTGVVKQIAGNVRDAATRVQQVDENMNGIEQAANDSGVAADQVSGASNEVSTTFDELKSQLQSVLETMGVAHS